MILTELLNKATPLTVLKDSDKSYKAKATFGNREIEFRFSKWPPPNDNRWNFTFVELGDEDEDEDGTYKATGSGNELAVFATAKRFLEIAIAKYQPKVVYFEADKTQGSSRAKLYKRFTERWAPPGYKHRIMADEKDAIYHAYVEEKLHKQLYGDEEKES